MLFSKSWEKELQKPGFYCKGPLGLTIRSDLLLDCSEAITSAHETELIR